MITSLQKISNMEKYKFAFLPILGMMVLLIACQKDEDVTDPEMTDSDATLHVAFAEFDQDETDIYLDGNSVVIETTGLPNHTTSYWGEGHALYVAEPEVRATPSLIPGRDASATLVGPVNPELAISATATRLGAIEIAVSGAAIYNEEEGN